MAYYDVDRRVAGQIPGNSNISGSMHGAGPGEKSTGEYIVSGIPFVTSSTHGAATGQPYELKFPTMTQWVLVQNLDTGTTLDFGFSETGVGGNQKFTVAKAGTNSDNPNSSIKLDIRTKSIFIKGTEGDAYQIVAGLTDIQTGSIQAHVANPYWGV